VDPNRAVENDWWKVLLYGALTILIGLLLIYHFAMAEHNIVACSQVMKEFNECKADDTCQYSMELHEKVKKCL